MAMEGVVSWPNAVCLALAGFLVAHLLLSHDPTASTPSPTQTPTPTPDHPEDSYCCLGTRPRARPADTCSSPACIFYACASLRLTHATEPDADERNQTEDAEDGLDDVIKEEMRTADVSGDQKEPDEREEEELKENEREKNTSSVVDTMVVGLLVCSAAVSLREWCRERNRAKVVGGGGDGGGGGGVDVGGGGGGGAGERRISLADLTFNRHLRRADSHHHNGTPTTGRSVPPLVRRSSFPAQLQMPTSRAPPQRQQSSPGLPLPPPPSHPIAAPSRRRLSADLDDDSSPDRRRVRIIRRH